MRSTDSEHCIVQANPGKVALILAHDNVTCSLGQCLPLLAASVPFRAGGVAAILSSRSVPQIDALPGRFVSRS